MTSWSILIHPVPRRIKMSAAVGLNKQIGRGANSVSLTLLDSTSVDRKSIFQVVLVAAHAGGDPAHDDVGPPLSLAACVHCTL